jgi:hypothetical protein
MELMVTTTADYEQSLLRGQAINRNRTAKGDRCAGCQKSKEDGIVFVVIPK